MRLSSIALLALLTWGALAFGAEYSWAYAPLIVFGAVTGILGMRASGQGRLPSRSLLLLLGAIVMVATVQALPVPEVVRNAARRSGPAVEYRKLHAVTIQQPPPAESVSRSLSISPERTTLGLAFLCSLGILFVGQTRAFGSLGMRTAPPGIVALGVVVAFVGIIQAAIRSEEIYGFWRPPKAEIPFAPFVNENHFAGWMVMAMSLAAGSLSGGIASAMRHVRPGWRDRARWLLSPSASAVILTGFGVAVMALAMVITRSRGGLIGLATAALISAWWVARRQSTGARRIAGVVALMLILLLVTSWGGVERTLAEFDGSSLDWGGRRQIWLDAWRVIQDHPWTGTGLNTLGIAMLHYQTSPGPERVIEAHNDYLQLAAEGGLLLGIPILITVALFIREVWRRFKEGADDERTYWLRAGAVTGLCSIAVMETFDFTLQMPGAAVLFVVLAAIAIHRPDYLARRRESRAHHE